jgi:hypothetical protein
MTTRAEVKIAGKTLVLSNLSKVLYPEARFTKGKVIDYYIQIPPVLLPHLKDRPLTLKRRSQSFDLGDSSGTFANHFPRFLIFTQAEKNRLAKISVTSPLKESHLADKIGS